MRRRHLWFGLWLALTLAWDSGAWGQTLEDYVNEGVQRYNRSDFRGAIEAWEQGLALAKEQRDLQATGAFLGNLGNVYTDLGDYPKAWNSSGKRWRLERPSSTGRGKGRLSTTLAISTRDSVTTPRPWNSSGRR